MSFSSQELESYLPVYDTIPEKWEEGRQFLVEELKRISNVVNSREIGFYLDQELLTGKAFIPVTAIPGNNPGQFRQVFRMVIEVGPITAVTITVAHGITFDVNFTLVDLWAAATNQSTFDATIFGNSDTISMNSVDVIIVSNGVYNVCNVVIEYMLEV